MQVAASYCDGISSVDHLVEIILSDTRLVDADLPPDLAKASETDASSDRNTVRGSSHCVVA